MKMTLGSQNWVVERIMGLLTVKGEIVEEGEAEMIHLASEMLSFWRCRSRWGEWLTSSVQSSLELRGGARLPEV